MNDEKLVSVIITTYKRRAEIVKRAIDSVLNQSYTNIELLIIDDSPNDYEYRNEVKATIENIADNRINYIQHEYNRGACVARNTGIRKSAGEYIAFLDDDDTWYTEKLAKQIKKAKDSKCDFVYCRKSSYNVSKNTKKVKYDKFYRGMVFNELLWDNFIGPTSVALIKKSCFDKVGLFNEELKASQDYEMWLRITREFSVDYVDEPLLNYYIYDGDRISKSVKNKIQGAEKINEIYHEDIIKDNRLYAVKIGVLVPRYISDRQYKKAWKYYVKAYKSAPLFMIKRIKYNIRCFYFLLKFWILNKK